MPEEVEFGPGLSIFPEPFAGVTLRKLLAVSMGNRGCYQNMIYLFIVVQKFSNM